MKLNHIGFWTKDIGVLVDFYKRHFDGEVLSSHEDGDFEGCFMRICSSITIELMSRSSVEDRVQGDRVGYSHFALEVGSREEVDRLTDYFESKQVPLEKMRVQYDDGFYETSVFDPDGNIIEIGFLDRAYSTKSMS